jgi:uncharacterized protein YndB with AHSA1/START domain
MIDMRRSTVNRPGRLRISGLKNRLESPMEKVFEIYIKTSPERLWEAITDPEMRSTYNFGARVTSDWTPGSRYEMGARDGTGGRRRRGSPSPEVKDAS